jgi:hypothetical protein
LRHVDVDPHPRRGELGPDSCQVVDPHLDAQPVAAQRLDAFDPARQFHHARRRQKLRMIDDLGAQLAQQPARHDNARNRLSG